MKNFILTLFLALPLIACGTTPIADNEVRLKIDGMSCEPCADTLIKKFSKEKSIASAEVDWESGEGRLIQKQGMQIKDVEIEKIVDWSGFDLISIDRASGE